MIGAGGTVDFLAGRLKRAPMWMRRIGTECVFRLWQEPRRLFKRYAGDLFSFVPALLAQLWQLPAGTAKRDAPQNAPSSAAMQQVWWAPSSPAPLSFFPMLLALSRLP